MCERVSICLALSLTWLCDPQAPLHRAGLHVRHYHGLHVRRMDKVVEARASGSPSCAYMQRLGQMANSSRSTTRDVFVATDDPSAVSELRACARVAWGEEWTLYSLVELYGAPPRGLNERAVYWLWAELMLLVRAELCVGTFSSNIGRLVQTLRSQPARTMTSMDKGYVSPMDSTPTNFHYVPK